MENKHTKAKEELEQNVRELVSKFQQEYPEFKVDGFDLDHTEIMSMAGTYLVTFVKADIKLR